MHGRIQDRNFRRCRVLHGIHWVPIQLSGAGQDDQFPVVPPTLRRRAHLDKLSPDLVVDQPCQLSLLFLVTGQRLQLAVKVCTCCSASLLAVRSVTMLVSSWPMRFVIATMLVANSSMTDVAAASRPGPRRDRGGTIHRELSCWQSKPVSTPSNLSYQQ